MLPQHPALLVQKRPDRGGVSYGALNKIRVFAVRHKADVLAVVLSGVDKSMGLGNLPHLGLMEAPQGEQRMGQLVLGQHIQEIGLVLGTVRRPLQQPAAAGRILFDAGVMSGGHAVAPQGPDPLEQRPEFHIPVAHRAGVRSSTRLVLVHEIPDDGIPKHLGKIKHIEGEAQPAGHQGGILGVGQGTAGLFPALAQVLVVEHPQIHTGELIALLPQQDRRHGTVHAAAHRHTHPHLSSSFSFHMVYTIRQLKSDMFFIGD